MELKHRMVMAPLTRFRADDDHVQLPFVKEYYSQRASVPGTLLITEATFITPRGGGMNNVPGLYTDAQLKAWKEITEAVHAKDSYIFCQLWALGRAADPEVLKKEGCDFLSSSAVGAGDNSPVPRAMEEKEILQFIDEYAEAAKRCIEIAGFDGVEIHGANGYLIDQFTQDTCNKRTDSWGGSIEKRARFGLEVAKAVTKAVGVERTGMRLSPWSTFQGMRMEDPIPQFTYLIEGLKKIGLAYLHLVESRIQGNADTEESGRLDFAFDLWKNQSPVLLAGGFRPYSAKKAVDEDYPSTEVAIVFGRYFISTPDLPFRVQHGIEFNEYNRHTFYKIKSEEGYIDYPFSAEFQRESKL